MWVFLIFMKKTPENPAVFYEENPALFEITIRRHPPALKKGRW